MQKAVYILYNIRKEYNLEIATKKTKVFGSVGTDHLRTKIVINYETLEQVGHFAYLGCSMEKGVYRVLVGKPGGRRPLGRPRRRWVDNIRMDLKEVVIWTALSWPRIETGGGRL